MFTVIITGSTTLMELNVSYNNIGDNGISVITEGLKSNKTLTKLDVSWCYFTEKGSYILAIVYMTCINWCIMNDVHKMMYFC